MSLREFIRASGKEVRAALKSAPEPEAGQMGTSAGGASAIGEAGKDKEVGEPGMRKKEKKGVRQSEEEDRAQKRRRKERARKEVHKERPKKVATPERQPVDEERPMEETDRPATPSSLLWK